VGTTRPKKSYTKREKGKGPRRSGKGYDVERVAGRERLASWQPPLCKKSGKGARKTRVQKTPCKNIAARTGPGCTSYEQQALLRRKAEVKEERRWEALNVTPCATIDQEKVTRERVKSMSCLSRGASRLPAAVGGGGDQKGKTEPSAPIANLWGDLAPTGDLGTKKTNQRKEENTKKNPQRRHQDFFITAQLLGAQKKGGQAEGNS